MNATYVSTTSFTVVGDQTTIFVTGRRVKCNCGVDGYDYGTILSSAYTTLTTITLTAASDDITANLTAVEWSAVTPASVPSKLTRTLELNEQAILVDAALASDHTWTGPTQSVTAGEILTVGETAYLKSDGKYWLADANAEATADTKLVMATATISADATGIVLLPGDLSFFRDDSTTEWTVTAAGDVMYVSTTAGELTNDVSGYTTLDIVRVCGYMETATVLNFNVGKTIVEVA
jgi:hypothetical protein